MYDIRTKSHNKPTEIQFADLLEDSACIIEKTESETGEPAICIQGCDGEMNVIVLGSDVPHLIEALGKATDFGWLHEGE